MLRFFRFCTFFKFCIYGCSNAYVKFELNVNVKMCEIMKLYKRITVELFRCFFAGKCISFSDFVAEQHADNDAQDGAYVNPVCFDTGHNSTCSLACQAGFELSNGQHSGSFICDPDVSPFPGWRQGDSTVATSVDALCTPGKHYVVHLIMIGHIIRRFNFDVQMNV